jgi:integrase
VGVVSTRRTNGEGSIYPYPHGFRAYVWVTTPSGRRQRKYVAGKTREDVREKYLKLHEASRRGVVATRVPTLGQFLDGWLEEVVAPSLAPATVASYRMCTRLYIAPELGAKRLDKLTVRDVQAWLNRLRLVCQCCAQGKDAERARPPCCAIGRCCRQLLADWTVHQAYAVLRAGLSQAAREELVTRNVAALVRVSVPRATSREVWTVEDARRFLESSRDAGDPYHGGYVLLLVLGLRRGEVLGLTWSDVDLEAGEAHIRWQLQRVGGELSLRRTKTTSSEAVLPLPEICGEALISHRAMTSAWRLAAGPAWHDTGLVLSTRFGLPIDPRNFHRKFKERALAAGVPVVPVHSTRRTCASLLVELDVHPRVAMQILRHSQISVTMDIYSQVASASTREALTRLGTRLDYGRS